MDSREPKTMAEVVPAPRRVGVHVPAGCDEDKILKALVKLETVPLPISNSNSALLPLAPMEKGFVLGILAAVRRGE